VTACLADLGDQIDAVLAWLGIHGVSRFEAVSCILGAIVLVVLCAAVRSAVRMALLRCPVRK
jgi:hypothetical protein